LKYDCVRLCNEFPRELADRMHWVDLLNLSPETHHTHLCSKCQEDHLNTEIFNTIIIPSTIFPSSTFYKDFLDDFENQITKLGEDIDVALSFDSCAVNQSAVFCFDSHQYCGFVDQSITDNHQTILASSYLLFVLTSIKTGWRKALKVLKVLKKKKKQ
jgi:hypothetical protein